MIPTCLQLFINFLLSVPPVSYRVHVSVAKSLSIKMDGVSLCTLFTLTWLSVTDPKWKALWHKYMDTELGAHWCRWHLPQHCCMQKMPPCTTRKRVQPYFIISRNNSNLMQLRRHRVHLGITCETFWNKTENVDQSDLSDVQTKMKTRRHSLIRAQNSQVNYENLHKTSTAKTLYPSFVLILHEILIYSKWKELKKRFQEETWWKKNPYWK